MRNRGIEIFLLPEPRHANPAPSVDAAGELAELVAVLGLAGVPGSQLPAAMAAAHETVAATAAQGHRRGPGLRELRRWAALTSVLASRGWSCSEALSTAFQQVYVRPEAASSGTASAAAEAAFDAHCSLVLAGQHGSTQDLILYQPAAWPVPLDVATFAGTSEVAAVARDGALLLQHLATLAALQVASRDATTSLGATLSQRASLVEQWGLAAACALPADLLQAVLAGSAALVGEGASAASQGVRRQMAMAAAQLLAERSCAGQGSARAAYAAALAQQLQHALACAGVASPSAAAAAARQAAQMVASVLMHPLVSAAAALHSELVSVVQLPPASCAVLPLEASQDEKLQRYLLAAGVQAEAGGCEARVVELCRQAHEYGSKLQLLWHAARAAAELQSAASEADAAVATGTPTLLQVSAWRHSRPKVRILPGIQVWSAA